ncbi:unnamed protein product [Darwinula stevensoni]|uniref:Serpin domain-containing protein n=1 Tax=Darwinula stevensoni TaxID=69355 RepID=A0A7R9A3Q3_9CRUS|nr:unnamed protein product [Darwinula stevensoni]CAG0881794.1 unnamed protein product [Darwinula stevensoni]
MGVEDMFKWGSANFSGISQEIIYVTDIFHKAYIEVDEKGSEAAAATGLVFFTRSGLDSPRIIVVNRPFLFFITLHAPNADLRQAPQAILFAGRVSKPPPRLSSSA